MLKSPGRSKLKKLHGKYKIPLHLHSLPLPLQNLLTLLPPCFFVLRTPMLGMASCIMPSSKHNTLINQYRYSLTVQLIIECYTISQECCTILIQAVILLIDDVILLFPLFVHLSDFSYDYVYILRGCILY